MAGTTNLAAAGSAGNQATVASGGAGTGTATATGGATNMSLGGSAGSEPTGGFGGAAGSGVDLGFAGPVVAFPGAEGFGRDARGGRGGDVCHVTTLPDSGAGSLRDCVSQGNRTVVFDVGGWTTLSSNLGITQSHLTIAGQTAPGNGVGIRGRKVSIAGSHIVMRY